jgi:hypothetical protein
VASNQASDGKPSRGGRLRSLIPFFRKRPRPATVPPQVATSSLAVRPPWWRGAVQRMIGGLWPGFRAGQDNTDVRSSSAAAGAPGRPLIVRRRPLAGKASSSLVQVRREVKRAPLTAPRVHDTTKPHDTTKSSAFGVFGGLTPQPTPPLTMAPPPGAPAGVGAGLAESAPGQAVSHRLESHRPESSQLESHRPEPHRLEQNRLTLGVSAPGITESPAAAPLAKQPQHVIVQREAARLALAMPPSRSLAHPPKRAHQQPQAGTRTSQVRVQRTKQAAPAQGHSHSASHSHAHSHGHTHSHGADGRTITPEQRWREAVSQVPLETPLPFPKHMQPLVAQLTGKAHGARYTAGSATRRALNEVGALGATTGSVVHLAQQPSMAPSAMGVLAHELTHARVPVSRPRFMLHNHTGAMDSDERQARSVGSMFQGASLSPAASSAAPVRVQRFGLPSASGLVGGLRDQATSAVSSLGNQATGAVGGLRDRAESAIGDGASAVTNQVSSAASGLSDRFTSAAGDFGNRMASEASTVTAGIVDSLPVGGGANGVVTAVSQMAQTVVENAVREATQTATAQASQAVGEMSQAAQNMASNLQSMATSGVSGLAGQANQMVSGAMGQATGALQGLGDQAMGALGDAQNAVTSGVSGVSGVSGLANQAMGAASNALGPGASQAISGLDLDRLAEALEERLLRQIERRGGRYAGVF